MTDTDETTKLVIYGLGIGALLFFAYIIFKDYNNIRYSYPQERQRKYGFMDENTSLEQIENKLSKLEAKIDSLSKSKIQSLSNTQSNIQTNTQSNTQTNTQTNTQSNTQIEKPERSVVSMKNPSTSIKSLDIIKNRLEYFGMK